jgi:hypothetical protein
MADTGVGTLIRKYNKKMEINCGGNHLMTSIDPDTHF